MNQLFKTNNLQIFKFFVSGVIASTINFVTYSSIFFIFKNIIFASICGYSIGILTSFIFAKIWVFKSKSKRPIVKSFIIFCLIYFLGGIEMSLVIILLNHLFYDYKIAWLFGASISSLNNYLGSKYLLFHD